MSPPPFLRLYLTSAFAALWVSLVPTPGRAQAGPDRRIEVTCHVFQTARDAPVVPGKPTVIRVYADWTEETDPFDREQLAFHEATVRIRAGDIDLPPIKKTFWRPDQHTRADSALAEITANHYGWRPESGDGRRPVVVRATVEFESATTGKTYEYDAACPVVALRSAPVLTVDYYLVKTREWWEMDDASTWAELQSEGHRLMQEGIEFADLNFPVGEFRPRFGGVLGYNRWWDDETADEIAAVLYDRAHAANPRADIIVGLVPPSLGPDWAGKMMSFLEPGSDHHSRYIGGKRLIFVELDQPLAITTVAHEIGHFYGLCHAFPVGEIWVPETPDQANNCARTDRLRIEGFRTRADNGSNRSETEGNGSAPELQGMVIAPILDGSGSGAVPYGSTMEWTPNAQYARLVQNLDLLGLYLRPPTMVPGGGQGEAPDPAGPQSGPVGGPTPDGPSGEPSRREVHPRGSARTPYMMVSGVVFPDGEVRLHPVQLMDFDRPSAPEGSAYTLETMDGAGGVLDRMPFTALEARSPHGTDTGKAFFNVTLPIRAAASEVRVLRAGTVVARQTRSASAPQVTLLSPAPGQRWDGTTPIQWQGSDPDGDALSYDVMYSSDGIAWTTLATRVRATALPGIGPQDLEPGPSPRVRVVALDGFHTTVAEARFELEGGFRLLASTPRGDSVPAGLDAVRVRFNRPMDPATVNAGNFGIMAGGGTAVAARIEIDSDPRSVRIRPDSILDPSTAYEVVISGQVSDTGGDRLAEAVRWSFTTKPDRRRPRIVGMLPMPRALGAAPGVGVVIRFDESLDPSTVRDGALTVDEVGGGRVAGQWEWNEPGRAAIFRPASPWTALATYRVTVTDQVTDVAGNPVRSPAPWDFTVAGRIRPGGG
jgi:hypothetical protein